MSVQSGGEDGQPYVVEVEGDPCTGMVEDAAPEVAIGAQAEHHEQRVGAYVVGPLGAVGAQHQHVGLASGHGGVESASNGHEMV